MDRSQTTSVQLPSPNGVFLEPDSNVQLQRLSQSPFVILYTKTQNLTNRDRPADAGLAEVGVASREPVGEPWSDGIW